MLQYLEKTFNLDLSTLRTAMAGHVFGLIATLVIVLPVGVGAAIYLTEYASGKKVVAIIEYAAETLSGIPSIIYGLVGMLFFCQFLDMQTSLLAGALTLVMMNLPTIMRTTQESLKTVPQSYREGAFGLGAGKWRVIRTVVLPGCVDGVITGCILAVGRILGESAALLFTAGNVCVERVFGMVRSKTLIFLFYFLVLLLMAIPGIVAAVVCAIWVPAWEVAAGLLAMTVVNAAIAVLVLWLCRNLLQYAELNSR